MPISRNLYTSNFASFKKGVSRGMLIESHKKNLSIVFTYTERLKELFLQLNVRMFINLIMKLG